MIKKDAPARIPPLGVEERTPAAQSVMDTLTFPGQLNIDNNPVLNTFAQHPQLTQPFLVFNRHLLTTSTLPVRLRQIAILRIAWQKRGRYIWSSHLRTSLRAGLSGEDLLKVKDGHVAKHWNTEEQLILKATDQLAATSDLDDTLWLSLSEFLDQQQLMDFLFTVGTYMQLAMVCNAMRIEREPELLELAERYGAP